MYFARTVRLVPMSGRQKEVEQMLDERLEWLRTQKGFVLGMRLYDRRRPEEIGYMSLWESREDANQVATTEHLMALNSRLAGLARDRLIEWGSAEVRNFVLEMDKV